MKNKKNLRLLADYLITGKTAVQFDMNTYATPDVREERFFRFKDDYEFPKHFLDFIKAGEHDCGTAACAIGHAPAAGIKPRRYESWHSYSHRTLAEPFSAEWHWAFGPEWAAVDNTAIGAAKRIYWMLEHGVPENAEDQAWGTSPICYDASHLMTAIVPK